MAYEARTMPVKVATFATCSSVLSPGSDGSSSRGAKATPGTRIPFVGSMRNRQGPSSMRRMCMEPLLPAPEDAARGTPHLPHLPVNAGGDPGATSGRAAPATTVTRRAGRGE
ncbi:phosphoglycolate phosphatase [Streptomyces sp. NBRC 110611]|nr:phosphoglycolate phosphatase [Streptomyces sp. NBRC 110611]